MHNQETSVRRLVRMISRAKALEKAVAGAITWRQAAAIAGITPRQMRRLRARYEAEGAEGLRDRRMGKPQPRRYGEGLELEVCRLKQSTYPDFSVRHFHEFLTSKHELTVSYSWTRKVLLAHGVVAPAKGRGRYRRRRARRPMTGMLLHLDASTHGWLPGLPNHDLVVMLDDADGRVLFARFFTQENTLSVLAAVRHVLERHGRFCELYTDRASHFCNTTDASKGPDIRQGGVLPRILAALDIDHIRANSPEARGRGERAFSTFQGRLPPELRLHGITDYPSANVYLERHFVPSFNQKFTVEPAQPESAFSPLENVDVELLLSIRHERTVANDNTIRFQRLKLQLPSDEHRAHYVRCTVFVHELPDESLAVSHDGRLIARFDRISGALEIRRRPDEMFCHEHRRTVRPGHKVLFDHLVITVPKSTNGDTLVGRTVDIREYRDGILEVSLDDTALAIIHRNSNLLERRPR